MQPFSVFGIVKGSAFLFLRDGFGHYDRILGMSCILFVLEDVIFAGEDRIEEDSDDGTDCQTGEGDDDLAARNDDRACGAVGNTDRKNEDEGSDDDVSCLAEVDLILNDVSDTDGGDHSVENE